MAWFGILRGESWVEDSQSKPLKEGLLMFVWHVANILWPLVPRLYAQCEVLLTMSQTW